MNMNLPRRPLVSNAPLVTVRLSRADAKALRLYSHATGTAMSAILKGLVADWVKVHGSVHPTHTAAVRPSAPLAVIPATHETRENTGRNEPIATLQKIDASRKEKKDAAKVRD